MVFKPTQELFNLTTFIASCSNVDCSDNIKYTQAKTEQMTEPVRCLATTGCYVAGWMKSFICNCHNCEDHFHLYSLAAVHSYYLYHIYTSYNIGFC